jgi:hypothetical protein
LNPQAHERCFRHFLLGEATWTRREDRRMRQEGSAKIFDTPWSTTLYQILPNHTPTRIEGELGLGLIKSTIQERRRDRQRPAS